MRKQLNPLDKALGALIQKKGVLKNADYQRHLKSLGAQYTQLITQHSESINQLRTTNLESWYTGSMLLAQAHRNLASCTLERLGANDAPETLEQARLCSSLLKKTTEQLTQARSFPRAICQIRSLKSQHATPIQKEKSNINSLLANTYQSIAVAYYNLGAHLTEQSEGGDEDQALIKKVYETAKSAYDTVLDYAPAREAAITQEKMDADQAMLAAGITPDADETSEDDVHQAKRSRPTT